MSICPFYSDSNSIPAPSVLGEKTTLPVASTLVYLTAGSAWGILTTLYLLISCLGNSSALGIDPPSKNSLLVPN